MSQNVTRKRHAERVGSWNEFGVGQWYWVGDADEKDEDDKRWLGCITYIGSNYVELTGPSATYPNSQHSVRIHLNQFEKYLTAEPNAEMFIRDKVEQYRLRTAELMQEVKQLTASLAITPRNTLQGSDGDATQAISIRNKDQDIGKYKKALIKAKDKQLPELFKQLRDNNELMASWMSAAVIPLEAEASVLGELQNTIKGRIFNVELYAGLIEEVKCIKEGTPAPLTEKVRLFQRRCYMDEECLANYETGGMEFKNIAAFDKWFVKPENLSRLLPYQRCVVAFQVRRYTKEREAARSLSGYIDLMYLEHADKLTFLYMRNGERVYRLQTGIDFGKQLFPDTNLNLLEGRVYAKMWSSQRVHDVIGESEYLGMCDDLKARRAELAKTIRAQRAKGVKIKRTSLNDNLSYEKWSLERDERELKEYFEWTPDSVYYDDVADYIKEKIDEHNRMVLVLQGLFDRSEVFHPHPPLQLWTHEGFNQALELIFDDSRALVAGDKPDFEAYRNELNKTLKRGSITVGQHDYWLRKEGEKETRRRENDYRWKGDTHVERYEPYGDPGPAKVARIAEFGAKRGATFFWTKERSYRSYKSSEINRKIRVPPAELLNVSAYTPGDFKLFYGDPRTRALYLEWAPLLLEAEEYYAGNRKVE